MAENTQEYEQVFQIDQPEVEVGILGPQDKFVSLIEQGMEVTLNPFGGNLKVTGGLLSTLLTYIVKRLLRTEKANQFGLRILASASTLMQLSIMILPLGLVQRGQGRHTLPLPWR